MTRSYHRNEKQFERLSAIWAPQPSTTLAFPLPWRSYILPSKYDYHHNTQQKEWNHQDNEINSRKSGFCDHWYSKKKHKLQNCNKKFDSSARSKNINLPLMCYNASYITCPHVCFQQITWIQKWLMFIPPITLRPLAAFLIVFNYIFQILEWAIPEMKSWNFKRGCQYQIIPCDTGWWGEEWGGSDGGGGWGVVMSGINLVWVILLKGTFLSELH